MSSTKEILLFHDQDISVTNIQIRVGNRSYAMSKLLSAQLLTEESRLFFPIFILIIIGICLTLIALTNIRELSHFMEIGLYIGLGVLILFLLSQRTHYTIRLRGIQGEADILTLDDRQVAEHIVEIINSVLVQQAELQVNI